MVRIPAFTNYYKPLKRPTETQKIEIAQEFHSWILLNLMKRIHKEFVIKSLGKTDSLGVKWKPLSKNREIYKTLARGEVSPRVRRAIREGRITKKEALKNRKTRINVDTGKLEEALRPGRVVNRTYIPRSSHQVTRVTSRGFSFKIDIKYADDVQDARPFLPEDYGPWLNDAIIESLPNLRIAMKRNRLI